MANVIHADTLTFHSTRFGDWCDYNSFYVKFTIDRALTDFATGTVTAEGRERLAQALYTSKKLTRGYKPGDVRIDRIEARTMDQATMNTGSCEGLLWLEYVNSIGD